VLLDLTAGVDPTTVAEAVGEMAAAGVELVGVIESADDAPASTGETAG
jgi:hypothetical protein